ncbi:sulfate adenylyltransferase subunit 1 [Anseongella ginsenosidimutans]|uniref:sulfate adenylyltransferase n=2 Tax=Anseongella ginsenosidimutans TaxID=496056 RepID=A0A4R3KRF0_9SPHI|nr:sulfate adenylyltransferase subunit CysN [Anseongella ginsenosidimutans]TCS86709.1 sulfate adenylyltransferase subunit 1 [Anseongella ginsenosidimutans]
MEILRFTTAGSVDDGKSTLIGRLLYDSKSIFEDQIAAVKASSERKGLANIDLSLLTDGLKAEREQGITIDVAYRYFTTPKRKFIIADTPGHIQYTRNMVTGASTANLALILVDARNGVVEQTCRHSYIASLLEIPHLVVCINKMDLVDYSEEVFNRISEQFNEFASKLVVNDIRYIPISALHGDNVVDRSKNMDWYQGGTLLNTLETIHIGSDENHIDARFPVQTIIRPHSDEHHDYRGYAGRVAGGIFRPGDKVVVLPSGLSSTIRSIDTFTGSINEAFPPMSVSMTLEDDIDISRGDMIVKENNQPQMEQDIDIMICWLNARGPQPGAKYTIRHTSRETRAVIKDVVYKMDINTLQRVENDAELKMNDIARVRLRTMQRLIFDSYRRNRNTGSLVLIDENTNETVAAGMIV